MFVSRSVFIRMQRSFVVVVRCQSSTSEKNTRSLLTRVNQLKSKDLSPFFTEEERQRFFQSKRNSGGQFTSLEQLTINNEPFLAFLSKSSREEKSSKVHRIQIEPRLTKKSIEEMESVFSVDYTSSHVNWARLRLTKNTNDIEVGQFNSIPLRLERKFHFLRTFEQFSSLLVDLPFRCGETILLDQSSSRLSNLQLATYLSQLQQTRAVFHTLIHCRSSSSIYHISSRDVFLHFGLFVGNEQSSAEFYLTNLLFADDDEKKKSTLVKINDQLKGEFYRTSQGQREPLAQCLLRALAFLQHVRERRNRKEEEEKE